MDLDPSSTTSIALVVLLEATLYFAFAQLVKKDRRRNGYFFALLSLHISQRRIVLNARDLPSVFGWAVYRNEPIEAQIEASGQADASVWDAITPPPSVTPHAFNVSNAVHLHNQLVEHVLAIAPEFEPRIRKDWFSLYNNPEFGPSGADIRHRLTAPVADFLSNIYVWDLEVFSLTPHVRGVAWPEFLSPLPESDEGILFYDSLPECIVLYHTNVPDREARGLVLDQRTYLARLMPTIWNDERSSAWAPFEVILSSWLEEARTGRWVIDPTREGGDIYGPPTGWRHLSWIEADVLETVRMWEAYLTLITAKIGYQQNAHAPTMIAGTTLLDSMSISGLERALLPRMRRPDFTFIAPGIRIPDTEMFRATLTEAVRRRNAAEEPDPDNPHKDYAVLLFYADHPVANMTYRELDARYTAPHWIEKYILDDKCGIYLGTWHAEMHADAVSLVAPRVQGNASYILFEQYSGIVSASLLHSKREQLAEAAGSYQPWRLYHMIARWYDLVVSGRWPVGPDGVEGSVEDIWDMMPDKWSG
ncbi:hypothetical protein ANO11243_063940 [Dothideomycetidae sp. 11243]|nr:hypothetical protein ANO11243_063940 [fungal sp. No.11243]